MIGVSFGLAKRNAQGAELGMCLLRALDADALLEHVGS
jgi:hypothetical protein